MLAYTQEVKDAAGVKDSFTEEKTDEVKKQEKEAKKIVDQFDEEHPEKEE